MTMLVKSHGDTVVPGTPCFVEEKHTENSKQEGAYLRIRSYFGQGEDINHGERKDTLIRRIDLSGHIAQSYQTSLQCVAEHRFDPSIEQYRSSVWQDTDPCWNQGNGCSSSTDARGWHPNPTVR